MLTPPNVKPKHTPTLTNFNVSAAPGVYSPMTQSWWSDGIASILCQIPTQEFKFQFQSTHPCPASISDARTDVRLQGHPVKFGWQEAWTWYISMYTVSTLVVWSYCIQWAIGLLHFSSQSQHCMHRSSWPWASVVHRHFYVVPCWILTCLSRYCTQIHLFIQLPYWHM